jgi:hypothetical protein
MLLLMPSSPIALEAKGDMRDAKQPSPSQTPTMHAGDLHVIGKIGQRGAAEQFI